MLFNMAAVAFWPLRGRRSSKFVWLLFFGEVSLVYLHRIRPVCVCKSFEPEQLGFVVFEVVVGLVPELLGLDGGFCLSRVFGWSCGHGGRCNLVILSVAIILSL